MEFNDIALAAAALFPAIVLFIYIYKKDRAEKEPLWLMLLLFAVGAASTVPAGEAESIVIPIFQNIFSGGSVAENNVIYIETVPFYIYTFLENFIGIALAEEGFKLIFLYIATFRSKHFNSLFDGMLYAGVVSLGFAALENIMYAFEYGWATVLMRMIVSVPGHMFFGVIMGYFYSFWNIFRNVDKLEKDAISRGMLPASRKKINTKRQMMLTLLVPVLGHGFFDFCLSTDETFFLVVFYIFLAGLYIFCFRRINKFSMADITYDSLLITVFLKRNPELLRKLSAVVSSEELRCRLGTGTVEKYRNVLNDYYILTYDEDPNVETPIEALLDEATQD